jgi:hypothetical protein
VPTREQVMRLLESGLDYRAVGERLGVPAGQAYLIATGVPADGSDALTPEQMRRPGFLAAGQHLVNPPSESPTTSDVVGRWLKKRAAADEPMRRAAARRDAEPGEVQDPEGVREVTTVLTRDHNRVTALLKQLSAIPGVKKGGSAVQQSRRQSVVDLITVELSRHEAAEQELLWPAVRRALPDGDELAARALTQEREGEDTLTALGRAAPDSTEFDDLVEELAARLRKHVAFEELVFARLREAMPRKERDRLGERLHRAERRAPTRPHPHAPKKPGPAVKAAGAAAAAADRVRDALGERPAERKGKADGDSSVDDR